MHYIPLLMLFNIELLRKRRKEIFSGGDGERKAGGAGRYGRARHDMRMLEKSSN